MSNTDSSQQSGMFSLAGSQLGLLTTPDLLCALEAWARLVYHEGRGASPTHLMRVAASLLPMFTMAQLQRLLSAVVDSPELSPLTDVLLERLAEFSQEGVA